MRRRILGIGIVGALALFACENPENTLTGPEVAAPSSKKPGPSIQAQSRKIDAQLMEILENVNRGLAAQGAGYRAAVAEWMGDKLPGNSVYFFDRGNKQFVHDFVPRDPRRAWSGPLDGRGDDITWTVDQTHDAAFAGGLSVAETTAAIRRAMSTWNSQACSNIPLTEVAAPAVDLGVEAFLSGEGGSLFVVADVQHAGWGDIDFEPGVLGVTFTFAFLDQNGWYTDIDRNGKIDVAFREIYYDPSSLWAIDDPTPGYIDVETIALHEMGHGLSQAHFGKFFVTWQNLRGHLAPYALMNPWYWGIQHTLTGTDVAGHCSNWASWPRR